MRGPNRRRGRVLFTARRRALQKCVVMPLYIDSTKAQFPRKVRPAERMVTTGGIHLLFQQRKNTLYKIETLKQKKSELF